MAMSMSWMRLRRGCPAKLQELCDPHITILMHIILYLHCEMVALLSESAGYHLPLHVFGKRQYSIIIRRQYPQTWCGQRTPPGSILWNFGGQWWMCMSYEAIVCNAYHGLDSVCSWELCLKRYGWFLNHEESLSTYQCVGRVVFLCSTCMQGKCMKIHVNGVKCAS